VKTEIISRIERIIAGTNTVQVSCFARVYIIKAIIIGVALYRMAMRTRRASAYSPIPSK
jgi:hypothetical protein